MASAKQDEVAKYSAGLVFKPGEEVDLHIVDEGHAILHSGSVYRQPDGMFDWSKWTETFVLLFDHYAVITTPKEKDGVMKYEVHKRPIPLELLDLGSFAGSPIPRTSGLLGGIRSKSSDPNSTLFPFTFSHIGSRGGSYTLFTSSLEDRDLWREKLAEAIKSRQIARSPGVFKLERIGGDGYVPSEAGVVSCSVPFVTPDGRQLVAVGCETGVWIRSHDEPTLLKHVLHIKHVTQCAFIQEHGLLLILAEKSLYSYLVESLLTPISAPIPPQKLSGSKDVFWFSAGTWNDRSLVIYSKKKGLDTVFRTLELNTENLAQQRELLTMDGDAPRASLDWFKVYRDFFLSKECFDLQFLKTKLAIICRGEFEIMDLLDFKSISIPQMDDPKLKTISKRVKSFKAKGMFRSNDAEFLLCYEDFGLFVDQHGDPSSKHTDLNELPIIEWEGKADHVAFYTPYILLFNSTFVEIRNVNTGRLCQIIRGDGIRCTWTGKTTVLPADDQDQEWHVQGVLLEGANKEGGGEVAEHEGKRVLFELVRC